MIDISPYWVYAGNLNCSYMMWDHMKIVEFIAMEIYNKFPDRQDRRLCIGDNTPMSGACDGHPGSSHAGCCVMDTNYYTLGKNNTTQYRPGKKGDACYELTYIWDESNGWPGNDPNKLLKDVFDWERNYYFVKRLKDFFPKTNLITNSVIRNYIMDEVKKKYGQNAATEFFKSMGSDLNPVYKHSHHFHMSLGDEIIYP